MLGVVMANASEISPTVRSRFLSISRMRRRVGSRRALKRRFNAYIFRQLSNYWQVFFRENCLCTFFRGAAEDLVRIPETRSAPSAFRARRSRTGRDKGARVFS